MIDLKQLTDEQLGDLYKGFFSKGEDKNLTDEVRQQNLLAANAVLTFVDAKRKSGNPTLADNLTEFSQKSLSSFLSIPGFPADLATGIVNRGLGAIPDKAFTALGVEEGNPFPIETAGSVTLPSGEVVPILPTSENLRKSVQALDKITGVEFIGDYQKPSETLGGKIGDVFGATAGALLPMIGIASRINQTRGLNAPKNIKEFLSKNIIDEVRTRPRRMIAAEGAAVGGITASREIGDRLDVGPTTQMTMDILAGMGSPAAVYAMTPMTSMGRSAYKAGKSKYKEARKAPDPNKKEGQIAARVLQEIVEDPNKVVARLSATAGDEIVPGRPLTVAQRSEDEVLNALEAKLIAESGNPNSAINANRNSEELVEELKNSILAMGSSIDDTARFARIRKSSFDDTIKLSLSKAANELNETLTRLRGANPDKSPEEISRISSIAIRESIEKSLDDVDAQEKILWNKVPKSVRGPQVNLVKEIKRQIKQLGVAQLEDIPSVAKFINTETYKKGGKLLTKQESMKNLNSMYIKLGEISRAALVAGDRTKSSLAISLQQAILKDFKSWKGTTGNRKVAADRIQAARDFSLSKNQYFRKGTVGKYLGYVKGADFRVTPAGTGPAILTGRGDARLDRALDISNAEKFALSVTGNSTDELRTLTGISDFVSARFLVDAFDDGVLNPTKARNFIKANEDLFRLIPDTRIQLMRARNQADVQRRITKTSEAYQSKLDTPADSTFAKLLNSDPNNAVRKILTADSPNRLDQWKLLVNLASKRSADNPIGKAGRPIAVEGLQNAINRYMLDEITSTSAFTKFTQTPTLNAQQLLYRLQNDEVLDQALRLVYSPKQMSSLRYSAKQMAAIQRSQMNLADFQLETALPGTIGRFLFRIAGTKVGGAVGGKTAGAPLVLAGAGSRTAQKLFNQLNPDKARRLIEQALVDEDLMKILLKMPVKPTSLKGKAKEVAKKIVTSISNAELKVLRGYMGAAATEAIAEDDEEVMLRREQMNQEAIEEILAF
jgi:hypothetical protein